jgi:NADH-quinone oxidoreductase subunit N
MNVSTTTGLLAMLPVIIIMVTGMIVLLLDSCVAPWRNARYLSAGLSLVGVMIAGCVSLNLLNGDPRGPVFGGAVTADPFSQACNQILLVTAALAILLGTTYLENRKLNLGEYYALVLFSTSGSMMMAAATDLIVLFIAIEILSVALYVLSGWARTDQRSEEAALKYFLLGAFAAGFLLYGIALIYGGSGIAGAGGTTNLAELAHRLDVQPPAMLVAGVALLLVGLAFKSALVPFHMWTPDVYEGAPTSVTAYMAAGAKIGAFAAIIRVFNAFFPIAGYWLGAIEVLAVLTMFVGNILAISQDNVKRMLAYSSIAHAGYLAVAVAAASSPVAAAHSQAVSAAVFYLLGYTLMTIGAFGVLVWMSRRGRDVQTLNDLKGLARIDPPAAYAMLVFMLSLGGIPPTMGFMGKWFIFNAAITAGQTWLALCLAGASIISIYFYLRIVWVMCFQEPDEKSARERAVAPFGVSLSVAVAVGCTLLFGILPNLVQPLMGAAATLLRP